MKETTVSVICMTVSYMLFSDILMNHGQMPLKKLSKGQNIIGTRIPFYNKNESVLATLVQTQIHCSVELELLCYFVFMYIE